MLKDLKIFDGSLTVKEQIQMHAQQIQQNVVGYVVVAGVTASLVFLVTGFLDISNIAYLMKGEMKSVDQTMQLLLQERGDTFNVLLETNHSLSVENIELRQRIISCKK